MAVTQGYYRFCDEGQLVLVIKDHKDGKLSGFTEVITMASNKEVYLLINRSDLEYVDRYDYPFIVDPDTGLVLWDTD